MLAEQFLKCGPAPRVGPRQGGGACQAQDVEGDEVRRLLCGGLEGCGAAAVQPVLQLLEREAARGVPHDEFAVQGGGVGQLRGAGHDLRKCGCHLGAAA